MKIQESLKVPQRDAVVKTGRDKLERMIGPRQFEVGNADAVAPQLVAQEAFHIRLDDVIASGCDHEDRRHTRMNDVAWRRALIAGRSLRRGAAAQVEHNLTHVDEIGLLWI